MLDHCTALLDNWTQALKKQKVKMEGELDALAQVAAKDLGLELGKTIKLEWHK